MRVPQRCSFNTGEWKPRQQHQQSERLQLHRATRLCACSGPAMKRPLSPDHLSENGKMNTAMFLRCFEEKVTWNDRTDYQFSNEKKRILFSLCEVCNIQLNSAAQAQIHYNGKSHLKRMKQLNNGKIPTNTSSGPLLLSNSSVFFRTITQGGTEHWNTDRFLPPQSIIANERLFLSAQLIRITLLLLAVLS
uniref:C2H2-type domain-containing protein n=1 Tax=Leptobrachium leishanense TaxID=445787 RepID=A0A8C5RA86_9ANUR